MTTRLPSIFVSHGGPNILARANNSTAKPVWSTLLQRTLKESNIQVDASNSEISKHIRGIVIVSAHWTSESATEPRITSTGGIHEQIYDFYGFPDELYKIPFKARGDPSLAQRVKSLVDTHLHTSSIMDARRGLDHGTWVPLKFAMDNHEASGTLLQQIPIVQVSLLAHKVSGGAETEADVKKHIELGRSLAKLREEGILIIGSGAETHNLQDAFRQMRDFSMDNANDPRLKTSEYASKFVRYLEESVVGKNRSVDNIVKYRTKCPHGTKAHPSQEHFLPFAVALGAALSNDQDQDFVAKKWFHSFDHGDLGMGIYGFHSV